MPLRGLRTKAQEDIALADIDIVADAQRFGCSPAILAFLIDKAKEREDVLPEEITASQIDSGARKLWLEETTDYFLRPAKLMPGAVGTMKHSYVNLERDKILAETRQKTKDGKISAKFDTAAILHDDFSVDLYDMKGTGWYKAKRCLREGVERAAWDYCMQVNLNAILLEETTAYLVNKMFLEFIPRDLHPRERAEAAKLGVEEADIILFEVPRFEKQVVLDAYYKLYEEKQAAYRNNYAPMCTDEQTWDGKRCKDWCPVVAQCMALAKLHNEEHPLDEKTVPIAKPFNEMPYKPPIQIAV